MGRTKSDLEAMAERYGWKPRPLTAEEIRNHMRPDELEFHENFNNAELTRALGEAAQREKNRRYKEQWDTLRAWQGQGTPEQMAAVIAEAQKFETAYPQFLSEYCPSNRDALLDWLKDRNLPIIYDNFVGGFEDLTLRGELILDGGICGVGDREISGHELASHPEIYKFLMPHPTPTPEAREQARIDGLSADDFLSEHSELQDRRVPPILWQKVNQVLITWVDQHVEYLRCPENEAAMTSAVLASGLPVSIQLLNSVYKNLLTSGQIKTNPDAQIAGQAVGITDLGGREYPGFPTESSKYSFKKLIRGMSSEEFQQRCNDDPKFAASVEALKK